MLTNKKAVSTFILIILILCAVIFGALLSYMWVMANFYLEPENTAELVITNVEFPVAHADYFYVTVMNPSHSLSGANITEIYLTVEGDSNLYKVTSTHPEGLPIFLEKGTSKTIKCNKNWGTFAGKTITVHISAKNASGAIASVNTKLVKLELETQLNPTVSCRHFNITIKNSKQSVVNLSLSKIYIGLEIINNIKSIPDGQNVTLPINLLTDIPVSLQCIFDWEGFRNPKIRVETLEGYYAEVTANTTASVLLLITSVMFNETNPNEFNITISNSDTSTTLVDISNITITYKNGAYYVTDSVNGSRAKPSFAPHYTLGRGKTVTFNHCIWNWRNYRDQNITINVYVKQGFAPASKTVKTPKEIVFKINASFDLTDTTRFFVNVTNMPCSLQNITVTQIKFNANPTSFTSENVSINESKQFDCAFDWTSFKGSTVTITVNASNVLVSQNVTLPYVKLKIVNANFTTNENGKGFNVSIENIVNSKVNATIVRSVVRFENETVFQSEGIGYMVEIGNGVTLVFSWDWSEYAGESVEVHVFTADGLEFVSAFIV